MRWKKIIHCDICAKIEKIYNRDIHAYVPAYESPVHECPLNDDTYYCNDMNITSIGNDTYNCTIKYNAKTIDAIDGEEIEWQEYKYNRKRWTREIITKKAITKIISFNFCKTTDDSDTTYFDPYIDDIRKFIEFKEIDKLSKEISAAQSRNFRDIITVKTNNPIIRNNIIREYYEPIILECKKKSIETLGSSIFCNNDTKATLVDVMITKFIKSKLPVEQKACPHVVR